MIYTYADLLKEFPIDENESVSDFVKRIPERIIKKYEITTNVKVISDGIRRELKRDRVIKVKRSETLVNGNVVSEKFGYIKDVEEPDLNEYDAVKLTTNPNGSSWVRYEKNKTLDAKILIDNLLLKTKSFKPPTFIVKKVKQNNNIAILNMYDAHLDKIALKSTCTDSNSLEQNIKKYKESFIKCLSYIDTHKVSEIIIPKGNDLFHTNSMNSSTKKGTQIEYLCDPYEAYELICQTEVELTALALQVAPVYFPFIKGNHDEDKVHALSFWINQMFKNTKGFSCDNSRRQRKYKQFGKNLFGFAHGDKEKSNIDKLPLFMAEEAKKEWSETTYRKWYCGDLHHNFEFKFMKSKDFVGCNVEYLRSVGGQDTWHNDFGWIGIPKTAYVSIWNHDKGNTDEHKHNIL